MEKYLKFNINRYIKVKLNDKGKDIYYHKNDWLNNYTGKEVIKPNYPDVDNEGYTKFQAWEFMEIYGSHLRIGFDVPFECDILIQAE